jgi:hypothetical protein
MALRKRRARHRSRSHARKHALRPSSIPARDDKRKYPDIASPSAGRREMPRDAASPWLREVPPNFRCPGILSTVGR